MRTLVIFAALLLCATHAQEGPAAPEILWDSWNVPHVYAEDASDLAYAFGWAQAQSHADLILRLYAQARGEAAAVLGEDMLDSDRRIHTFGIPERARDWYDAQDDAFRVYLDAFADGLNAYVRAHPDAIADPLEAVLPVTGIDLMAHAQRVMQYTFLMGNQLGLPVDLWRQARREMGSNAWAVGPGRSASGNAMLLGNPHLPWEDLFTFYEAHLSSPQYELYGATLVGFPVLLLGFNEHLGWTHTVNPIDGADLYELTLEGDGYRFDGEVRAFETEEANIRVLRPDGGFDEETVTVRSSVHGPVVAEEGDGALALRVAGLDQPGALEQWWEMGRAEDLDAFRSALEHLQVPLLYVVYADAEGNLLYLFNGLVPQRASGDWYDWAGTVPGASSETLWQDYLDFGELPLLVNPASGYVMNANDPPWTATLPRPFDRAAFPPHLAPAEPMMGRALRTQSILRRLDADASITFDEMIDLKFTNDSLLAERVLDDLLAAASASGSQEVAGATDVLRSWDGDFEPDSAGAPLFFLWYVGYLEARQQDVAVAAAPDGVSAIARATLDLRLAFERPWDPDAPLATPDGLAAPETAVAALASAAGQLLGLAGRLDVAWGDLVRMRADGLDLPATSTDGSLGVPQVLGLAPTESGELVVSAGDTFVFTVEFAEPLRAEAILTYGNASQPGFPRPGHQLATYALDELRPAWFERADVEANLHRLEVLE